MSLNFFLQRSQKFKITTNLRIICLNKPNV